MRPLNLDPFPYVKPAFERGKTFPIPTLARLADNKNVVFAIKQTEKFVDNKGLRKLGKTRKVKGNFQGRAPASSKQRANFLICWLSMN